MKTLEAHEIDKDEPLISLECGHTFSLSTLDGTVGLESVYSRDKEGNWAGLLELPSKLGAAPSCPHCREPIANIRRYPSSTPYPSPPPPSLTSFSFSSPPPLFCETHLLHSLFFDIHRYGRILAHVAMEQASIKFNLQTQNACHKYAHFLEQYDNDLKEYEARYAIPSFIYTICTCKKEKKVNYLLRDPRTMRDTRDINDARDKMRFTCEKTRDLCTNLKKLQPERRVYEMSVAALTHKKSLSIIPFSFPPHKNRNVKKDSLICKANIPPFYPPSSQPLIMALQISVSALTYKYRYFIYIL